MFACSCLRTRHRPGARASRPRWSGTGGNKCRAATVVSEPFDNAIAVVNLIVVGVVQNQVFGLGSISWISSDALNVPIDLAPAQRDEIVSLNGIATSADRNTIYVTLTGQNAVTSGILALPAFGSPPLVL
jgi:hypothetical protein